MLKKSTLILLGFAVLLSGIYAGVGYWKSVAETKRARAAMTARTASYLAEALNHAPELGSKINTVTEVHLAWVGDGPLKQVVTLHDYSMGNDSILLFGHRSPLRWPWYALGVSLIAFLAAAITMATKTRDNSGFGPGIPDIASTALWLRQQQLLQMMMWPRHPQLQDDISRRINPAGIGRGKSPWPFSFSTEYRNSCSRT